jgi:hypothetical protein
MASLITAAALGNLGRETRAPIAIVTAKKKGDRVAAVIHDVFCRLGSRHPLRGT